MGIPSCEFHVPISPTPAFLRRVHYLAASIEAFSGLATGAYRIVVTVGDRQRVDLDQHCPWARAYPIEWRWVDDGDFAAHSYWATAYNRFRYTFAADVVVMLDGDTLVVGPIADAVTAAATAPSLGAVPGFYSPFFVLPKLLAQRAPHAWWREIFARAGLAPPAFDMEHPAWPIMQAQRPQLGPELRWSPPYPNAGFMVASASVMSAIGGCIASDLALVRDLFDSLLDGQIALALVMARLDLRWAPLPIVYNFPNARPIADLYGASGGPIRVLHYLDRTQVDRTHDFQSDSAVVAMLNRRRLSATNQVLVERLRQLRDSHAVT